MHANDKADSGADALPGTDGCDTYTNRVTFADIGAEPTPDDERTDIKSNVCTDPSANPITNAPPNGLPPSNRHPVAGTDADSCPDQDAHADHIAKADTAADRTLRSWL